MIPLLESGKMCSDGMLEIFLKTPLETLKKFCFVSKNWGKFLSNPSFNQLYHKRNPRKQVLAFPAKNNQLALLKKPKPPIPDACFSLQVLPLECHNMVLVGSCEGLLAFSFAPWKNDAFIWNPTTKAGKVFHLPPPSQYEVCEVSTGLGFDTDKDDFKFIRLVSILGKKGSVIQVYSFAQNSSKEFSCVPFSPQNLNCHFIINDVPFWVGKDDIGGSVIFNFNPTTEVHRLFPYPVVDESRVVYVVSMRDEIGALAFSDSDFTLDFYSFESASWVKKYTIGPLQTFYDVKDIRTMRCFKSTLITWGLPWDTNFHDIAENHSLPISGLIHDLVPKMDESYLHMETLANVPGHNHYYPQSVGEVFRDFKARRASLIRALTYDFEELYMQSCRADENSYCLHGFPRDEWKVNVHGIDPLELPEPARGINLARNVMEKNEWQSFLARRSDDWLLSVAFFFGTRFGFNKDDRLRLFTLMNDLPTVSEVVTGTIKKHQEEMDIVSCTG